MKKRTKENIYYSITSLLALFLLILFMVWNYNYRKKQFDIDLFSADNIPFLIFLSFIFLLIVTIKIIQLYRAKNEL